MSGGFLYSVFSTSAHMHQHIKSTQNPRIKTLFQLREKSRNRKKEARFLIEGLRELEMAIVGNYEITAILYTPKILPNENLERLSKTLNKQTEYVQVSLEVYQKLAYRRTTEGILAVAKSKDTSLQQLKLTAQNPLLLIAESPEKPGNIGAILRTADAAGVDALIIANPKSDLYNPNSIRSSLGCIFTTIIATGTTTEIITFLKERSINSYAATLQESVDYTTLDYTKATAIVVGTEATGLSQEWRDHAANTISIPMHGHSDSINVSVAAGILIFEAKRQRKQ